MCSYLVQVFVGTIEFLNNAAVAAFLGSFSAFVFGIIAYDYTKRREKWARHHNATVKAEHLLSHRHLNQISGNIYLLKGAIETYAKGAFSENVLSPIENPELLSEFHNIELVNTYADYQSLVEKVNHDLEGWNRSNERLFTAALSGAVPPDDIKLNRKNLAERTEEIKNHMEDLMEETYTTGAYIREFLKVDKRPRFARLKPTEKIKISPEKVKKEREKFVKESEETMQKDREGRLEKYKK